VPDRLLPAADLLDYRGGDYVPTVKDLRERHQLTRKQLSDLFHIPERTIQSWELGDRSCPVYVFLMLDKLLQLFELSGALERFRKGEINGLL
jgi:transcriptional regulator with XRE-family HTH domain